MRMRVLGVSGALATTVALCLAGNFWFAEPAAAQKAAEVMARAPKPCRTSPPSIFWPRCGFRQDTIFNRSMPMPQWRLLRCGDSWAISQNGG